MFDTEQFIADCRSALAADESPRLVREVVARAVADPAAILKELGEPTRGGLYPLYRSEELTIINMVWAPYMTLMPHDHRMWAVIGIYTGREDNIFWRRISSRKGHIEAAGAKALAAGDAAPLKPDVIHSVVNPIPRLTAAIHIYGGDFFAAERSEWDPETLDEQRWTPEHAMRRFEESNWIIDHLGVDAA